MQVTVNFSCLQFRAPMARLGTGVAPVRMEWDGWCMVLVQITEHDNAEE